MINGRRAPIDGALMPAIDEKRINGAINGRSASIDGAIDVIDGINASAFRWWPAFHARKLRGTSRRLARNARTRQSDRMPVLVFSDDARDVLADRWHSDVLEDGGEAEEKDVEEEARA